MAIAAVIAYLVGWVATFYLVIPSVVQGPPGAWLYRACVLQPRSWPIGLPFVVAAFLVASTWPVVLVVWLIAGRRPPPLITTQALLDHYGVPYGGEGPVLTRVPKGIPKRLQGHPTRHPATFESSRHFWQLYLDRN